MLRSPGYYRSTQAYTTPEICGGLGDIRHGLDHIRLDHELTGRSDDAKRCVRQDSCNQQAGMFGTMLNTSNMIDRINDRMNLRKLCDCKEQQVNEASYYTVQDIKNIKQELAPYVERSVTNLEKYCDRVGIGDDYRGLGRNFREVPTSQLPSGQSLCNAAPVAPSRPTTSVAARPTVCSNNNHSVGKATAARRGLSSAPAALCCKNPADPARQYGVVVEPYKPPSDYRPEPVKYPPPVDYRPEPVKYPPPVDYRSEPVKYPPPFPDYRQEPDYKPAPTYNQEPQYGPVPEKKPSYKPIENCPEPGEKHLLCGHVGVSEKICEKDENCCYNRKHNKCYFKRDCVTLHGTGRSIQERCGINMVFPGTTEYHERYTRQPRKSALYDFVINPTPNYCIGGRPLAEACHHNVQTEYNTRYRWPDSNDIVKLPWLRRQ